MAQDLEDAAFPYYQQKDIDEATGDRLDQIGTIVNVQRGGRTDAAYRQRIRAENAILSSKGTANDLIEVLQLLAGTTNDVFYDDAYPKGALLRVEDYAWSVTQDRMDQNLFDLQRATPAGTEVDLVYSLTQANDDNVLRFSDTADTTEASQTYGLSNGTQADAAI